VVREIPATPAEQQLGERYFEVRNAKTNEIETVEFQDLTPIKTAAEKAEKPGQKKPGVTHTLRSLIEAGNTTLADEDIKSLYEVKKGQMTAEQARTVFNKLLAEKKNAATEAAEKPAEQKSVGKKELWQMTQAEFAALPQAKRAAKRFPHKTSAQVHRQYVERALAEGKDVPVNVLAEYPGITPLENPALGERIIPPTEAADKTKEIQARPPLTEQAVTDGKVKTITGREIPAPPVIRTDTPQKAKRDMQRLELWLQMQTMAEALSRNDGYNATIFGKFKPGKFSQADKDAVNVYLFNTENPQFIKEKAGTKTETKKATTEWPQPNKHGVYDESLAEQEEYKGKKATAAIHVLQVGPDAWVSSSRYHHKTGSMDGASHPLSDGPFKTKEEALKNAAFIIADSNEKLMKRNDSAGTMKAEARNIMLWASRIAGVEVKPETPAAGGALQAPEEIAPEALTVADIPESLEITTTAIHEKTGKKVRLKENAREAFTRVQADIDAFKGVTECLG
jgi:polyhydroxyalkanoate synthesis regulator phasin